MVCCVGGGNETGTIDIWCCGGVAARQAEGWRGGEGGEGRGGGGGVADGFLVSVCSASFLQVTSVRESGGCCREMFKVLISLLLPEHKSVSL